MFAKRFVVFAGVFVLLIILFGSFATSQAQGTLTPIEQLGKELFFDTNLSINGQQSCASCHDPKWGFTGPDSAVNAGPAIYQGALPNHFGNRRPPSAAYAGESPILHYDVDEEVWIGGMFWDGRATGDRLGHPLADQALGPFLNPLEQALPDERLACLVVRKADYAGLFEQVWGEGAIDCVRDVYGTYDRIALSIAEYEQSIEVNPFSSRYDAYLAGNTSALNAQELWGLELFEGKALCSACHPSEPGPYGEPPLFTDFTYDNLGTPRNMENPFYSMPPAFNPDGWGWIDPGLGGFLQSIGRPGYMDEWGKHKVPTLRNVDMRPNPGDVRSYAHNGFFKSLEEIVHFYNTRDVEFWPPPEVALNVNTDELGDLGLTAEEEAAIVAFLGTLTDE